MRLFVALALPDEIAAPLVLIQGGVPGARWAERSQLHLTLRFIGEADGLEARAIDDALLTIDAPAFSIALKGVGQFGGRNPNALWAGVAPNAALMHLQRKIESALQRVGVAPDTRKFTPHVTLARLKAAPTRRVMDYVSDHALYASQAFAIGAFILYSSQLTPNGSLYRAERAYQLKAQSPE
jgi:2'-5' RNA ligase